MLTQPWCTHQAQMNFSLQYYWLHIDLTAPVSIRSPKSRVPLEQPLQGMGPPAPEQQPAAPNAVKAVSSTAPSAALTKLPIVHNLAELVSFCQWFFEHMPLLVA